MKLPDTFSTITPEGKIEPLSVPTYMMSVHEATVMRDYLHWIEYRKYRVNLWCRECWQAQDHPTEIDFNDQAIGVMCERKLVVHIGPLPPFTRAFRTDVLWKPPQGVALPDEVPITRISDEEARLLRDYKRVLKEYNLLEGLYCDHCWDNNFHDGTTAVVTDRAIDIRCRCRHLQYRGGYAHH